MDKLTQYFPINTEGTDYAVGDIHGCFSLVQKELDAINFDPTKDRLFSVGDLVDRGSESNVVLEWLEKPWFHAILGNHEAMLIDADLNSDRPQDSDHFINGGQWFYMLTRDEQIELKERFRQLPYIMQVQTKAGNIGIVHADYPYQDWDMLKRMPVNELDLYRYLWSRERINHPNLFPIENIRAVIHGHTPVYCMMVINNIYFIDTGGWLERDGHFTLLNLNTLEPANPVARQAFVCSI